MKRKTFRAFLPVTLVIVMVGFLSAIFFVDANPALAASSKKKSHAETRTSAVDHAEARIKELQSALKITEDQKELWDNLAQVMRENAKEADALAKDRTENAKAMNAVEHMKLHSQNTESHLAQMKKLIPPFEAFYASLSDEQKKSTDTIFRTGKLGKHKMK